MSDSAERLLSRLAESGVLSPDDVEDLRVTFDSEAVTRDDAQLAEELVELKKLTPYQAETVSGGDLRELVIGNYVILDRLGEGGMGHVYKARHRDMDRIVAIKVLPPQAVSSQARLRRFRQEVKAAARLSHPNIVTAFDADVSSGIPYLVMEYVPGQDLQKVLAEHGRLPVDEAVDYVLQTARGLEYAHSVGVVHRDIKPANLLLDDRGVIRILDMGVAQLHALSSEAEDETEHRPVTRDGSMVGTADFMSPEQAANARRADARSDVYSLGCTLYFLLTNEPIFRGDSIVDRLLAHRERIPPSLRAARPEVRERLDDIFRRMVAKDPDARYQDMSQLIEDLERFEDDPRAKPQAAARVASDDLAPPRRSSFFRSLLIVVFAASLVAAGLWALDQYYPGEATMELSLNQAGARVMILDKATGAVRKNDTLTGNVLRTRLPSGTYQVQVFKDGFESEYRDVRLPPRKSLSVPIELKPAAADDSFIEDLIHE